MSVLSAVKRANAKPAPEESVALRATVLVSVLAATSATLAQGVGGPGVRIAATAGIAGGFAYSHWARHREGYLLKAFLAVGVLLAFGQFLSAASGLQTGAINEVQIPLAELFLWVQFLHSLDVPARRDLLFSLVSSLVLMAVAGVLSVSIDLGVNLAVWAVAAVASLVLAYRSEVASLPRLGRVDVPGVVRTRPRAGSLRPAIAVVALVAVVGTAVFLVVPAAGAGKAVAFPVRLPSRMPVPNPGGLANPSLGGEDPASPDGRRSSTGSGASSFGYFGFSRSMDTGARGRPDDTLVMRVRASRPDFWRGQTFDTFDGRVWTQSDQRVESVTGGSPLQLNGTAEDAALGVRHNPDFVQTVYVEAVGPNLVFASYAPAELHIDDSAVFEMSDGTIRTASHLPPGSVYTVVSRRPAVTEDILRTADRAAVRPPRAFLERYLQVPDTTTDRVRELAQSLRRATVYDTVRAMEAWMAANTAYTLDIPPLPRGADSVDRYLFVDQQGFCEQIASALVVMLRSVGVPARLAVGYTPGQRNPFTGLFEVRARDAHAWAEVWFPGLGWQAFDPTADVPLGGDPFSSAAGAGLFRYVRDRIPSVPARVGRAGVVVVAAGLPLVTVGWLVVTFAGRRRRRAREPWPARVAARLDALGAARGRSRRDWETTRRYADVLRQSVLPDPRVLTLADLIDEGAFGPPGYADRRAEAEALLQELERASR